MNYFKSPGTKVDCQFHFSATKHMTTFYKIIPGVNDLMAYWTRPQYSPIEYKQIISCKLLCDHKTYHLTETISDGSKLTSTTRALKPGSVCLINLIAKYNPASIDPGIGIATHTLYTSKFSSLDFGCKLNDMMKGQQKNIC